MGVPRELVPGLAECREREGSRRYGDQVRAVTGWKRRAGVALGVSVAVAGVLAWAASAASADEAVGGGTPARHVVIVGIGGLLWSDVSPRGTPNLWRIAERGAVGSLDVSGVKELTCPADGWLTLNGGARAEVPKPADGACPAEPAVWPRSGLVAAGVPVGAWVQGQERVDAYNGQFHWDPQWGLLGSSPGPGRCVTAVGPGAGLAVARPNGWVHGYLGVPSGLTFGRAGRVRAHCC